MIYKIKTTEAEYTIQADKFTEAYKKLENIEKHPTIKTVIIYQPTT